MCFLFVMIITYSFLFYVYCRSVAQNCCWSKKQKLFHSNAPIALRVSIHEVPGCPTDKICENTLKKYLVLQQVLNMHVIATLYTRLPKKTCSMIIFRYFSWSETPQKLVILSFCLIGNCISFKMTSR